LKPFGKSNGRTVQYHFNRVITLLADVHVGGYHAVFPDNFTVFEGTPKAYIVDLNTVQKVLLKDWENMAENSKKYQSDTIVLFGDLIAGMNPAECGRQMMFTEMDEQVKAFCALIEKYYRHIKTVFVLKGTSFHESKYVEELEKIALILKNKGFDAQYLGPIAHLRLMKEPKEIIANVAHEGTQAIVYPETPMARSINDMLREAARGNVPRAKLIIRGHRHVWEHIDKMGIHYIAIPCWQTFVPYEKAVEHYYAWQPDIGGVLLLIDDEGRIRVWEYLYPLPHMEDTLREG
jgi:hypothetical protein